MNIGEVPRQTHTHTQNQFHIAAPEFLRGRKDVAKSGEYAQPYAPCLICGTYACFWCSLGKCVFPPFRLFVG